MLAMFPRQLRLPDRSFFLFGPRGTGKTTWLRSTLPNAHWTDLVVDRELVRLMRDPGRFTQEVEALPTRSWVVIDEVQKLPALLNEVQDLIARHGQRYRFAITGSSARKLRRGDVNLLPGRLINRRFFPLTAAEMGADVPVDEILRFGCLPAVRSDARDAGRVDLLEAYAENYLTQEIRQEALVKSLASFTRFLEVAALMNAQVTNVAGIARDAAVARPTVQGYFDILVDTLIGTWLPAWRPRAKVKEVAIRSSTSSIPGRYAHWRAACVSRSRTRSAGTSWRPTCCTSCARGSTTRAAEGSSPTGVRPPARRWISSGVARRPSTASR